MIVVETLPDGEPGTIRTLQVMRAYSREAAASSRPVDRLAGRLVASAPGALLDQLRAWWGWMREHVVFRPDPPDIERVRAPDRLLADIDSEGRVAVDCDDLATLGAALLLAMGFRAVFLIAALPGRAWHHVYLGVVVGGKVLPLDPQESPDPFQHPAGVDRVAAFAV